MSRIGKKPISVPKGVEINVSEENYVKVKGPKGALEQQLPSEITIEFPGFCGSYFTDVRRPKRPVCRSACCRR